MKIVDIPRTEPITGPMIHVLFKGSVASSADDPSLADAVDAGIVVDAVLFAAAAAVAMALSAITASLLACACNATI